jgi:hypothetical protein
MSDLHAAQAGSCRHGGLLTALPCAVYVCCARGAGYWGKAWLNQSGGGGTALPTPVEGRTKTMNPPGISSLFHTPEIIRHYYELARSYHR